MDYAISGDQKDLGDALIERELANIPKEKVRAHLLPSISAGHRSVGNRRDFRF